MIKPIALALVLAVCAGPALAQADRSAYSCDRDPETTGALSTDPRSLYLPGERPDPDADKVEVTPAEDSWQEEAQEDAERRRQRLIACGVD